ncbi:hypothetical protein CFIMG_008042RA00001 [Ceratocystis fimbriata CBS 114723]|uniref:Uncharacterized protein n=1 Tax=Ceratocystis fimbriata CBS 114723 TaxID=1035309 RepID=A0A2C5X762_9PEZI|nr:hypothetical protein CFIMG_008042RA00001 [Ceratocystis fimbriata CBS 114723]
MSPFHDGPNNHDPPTRLTTSVSLSSLDEFRILPTKGSSSHRNFSLKLSPRLDTIQDACQPTLSRVPSCSCSQVQPVPSAAGSTSSSVSPSRSTSRTYNSALSQKLVQGEFQSGTIPIPDISARLRRSACRGDSFWWTPIGDENADVPIDHGKGMFWTGSSGYNNPEQAETRHRRRSE